MRQLHTYFRSSASYRVRIALNLKGLPYDSVPVDLRTDFGAALRTVNPSGLVPVLQDDTATLTQSLAIIEYLDECHPAPPLLGGSKAERARIRSLALDIACEIHPLCNLRVLKFLGAEMGVDDAGKQRWYRHWVETGLDAVEARVRAAPGRFCIGDVPTLADCCLVPQVFNAQRFACDTARWPTLMAVHERCQALDAFRRASPERQPDAD